MTREEATKYLQDIGMRFVPTDQYGDYDDPQPYEDAIAMAIEALSVVRCKDCKYFTHYAYGCGVCTEKNNILTYQNQNDFCSYGERKGGEDE